MNNQLHKYLICLESVLDSHWQQVFEDCEFSIKNQNTQIISDYIDQPKLHSLLRKVRDSGMSIIFIKQVDSNKG